MRQLAVEHEHAAAPRADVQPRRGHVGSRPGRRLRQPGPRLDADRPGPRRHLQRHEPAAARRVHRHAERRRCRASTAIAMRSWSSARGPRSRCRSASSSSAVSRTSGAWASTHNAGGNDPINGTYDYDADYGDTVDRVSFSALHPRHVAARDDRLGLGHDAPGLEPDHREQGPRGPPVRSRRQRRHQRLGRRDLEDGLAAGVPRHRRPRRHRVQLRRLLRVQDAELGRRSHAASRSAADFDSDDPLRPARPQDVLARPVGQARRRPGSARGRVRRRSSARSSTSTTTASPATQTSASSAAPAASPGRASRASCASASRAASPPATSGTT